MQKIKNWFSELFDSVNIWELFFATIGGIILAYTIRNIHTISPITEGGMLGLTLFIDHWTGISSSITTPIINIICYIFAYKILGKKFIFNSLFAVLSYSGFLHLFEMYPPIYPEIANMPLLASIIGGIGVGISCGFCVLANSAPTADDALVLGLKSKIKVNITVIYLISDLTVLALSLTYIDWRLILYSLLTVIISGQLIGIMEKLWILYKKNFPLNFLNIEQKI